MPVWLGLAVAVQAQSVWRQDNLFHLKHIAREKGRDLFGPEGSVQSKCRAGVKAAGLQQREEDCLFTHVSPSRLVFSPQKPVTLY